MHEDKHQRRPLQSTIPPRTNSTIAITAIAVYALTWGVTQYNGVLAEAIAATTAIIAITRNARYKDIASTKALALFILVLMTAFATSIEWLSGTEVSTLQIVRTGIWGILYFWLMIVGPNSLKNTHQETKQKIYNIVRLITIISAAAVAIDFATNTNLAPIVIKVSEADGNASRIYIVGSSALPALFLLFLSRKDNLPLLATVALILATQGKSMIATIPITIAIYSISHPKKGIVAFLVALPLLAIYTPFDRIADFQNEGDQQRTRQTTEAMDQYLSSTFTSIVGAGLGTPYSDGYAQFGRPNEEQANLFENTRFDIENGYAFLLMRYGPFGAALFLILTLRAFQDRATQWVFLLTTLLICFGGAFFATPGGIFFVTTYCFAAACLPNSDSTQKRTE